MIIHLEKITKEYNGKLVLDDITARFETGYIYIIRGVSGSGKTTFLNVISGVTVPDSGILRFDSDILNNRNIFEYRKKISIMFQNSYLINDLTLRENLEFYGKYDNKVNELLNELGIQERLDTMASALSVGERQRANLARALSGKPQIIFADEPDASLDNDNSEIIHRNLEEFANRGNTVFLVTHRKEHKFLKYREFFLDNGKLIPVL